MKSFTKILIALSLALFTLSANAGTQAGKDSAKYYKTNPEDWDGKKISVDCIFVTRINGCRQIDGVLFFVAHTIDDKNKKRGGNIVVAVSESESDSFIRKYGTVIERNRSKADKVESTRLRGTFHQLKHGHVYLDKSGEAHARILEHKEDASKKIRKGDGIPSEGTGEGTDRQGKHKKH